MKVELYHTTTELKQLFRKEKDPRLANRIRAVYLAMMNKSTPQIAQMRIDSKEKKVVGDFLFAGSVLCTDHVGYFHKSGGVVSFYFC